MLLTVLLLVLCALTQATALPFLQPRQFPSTFCNVSSLSPPSVAPGNSSAGFQLQEGQQVVAVALARGVQNYSCTFNSQIEAGVLALLYDVTCLAVALPTNATTAETSSTSSTSAASTGSAASDSVTTTPTDSAALTSLPVDGTPTITSSAPSGQVSLPPIPPDTLPPPLPLDPLSDFNLSLLPSLALQIPFPFNASSFPYLGGSGVLGEWYYVSATSGEAAGKNVPFFSLPPYGTVTARQVNRTAAPSEGRAGNQTAPPDVIDRDWTAYQAVDGGNGMFATTVWSVDTAGGALARQNCTGEGNTTSVDFASLVYFFR
ncbi:hypothetical protein JCM11251_000424 [Rhodosporidiobolus azoricus]